MNPHVAGTGSIPLLSGVKCLEGVLNFHKPKGITSQEAVNRVKEILGAGKAGHTGTLDPQASGVLVICLERATKVTGFIMNTTKGYRARMELGKETDTQDAWGKVVKSETIPSLDQNRIESTLKRFSGEIDQVPPLFSALKVKGRRMYQLAREGIEVERKSRKVHIYSIELEEYLSPMIQFSLRCSSGTYVRTICHDIGQILGCGGHMTALERTSVGQFKLEEAITLEQLEYLANRGEWEKALIPVNRALSFMPEFEVKREYVGQILNGAPVLAGWASKAEASFSCGQAVRITSWDSRLLAVGEAIVDGSQIREEEGDRRVFKIKRVLPLQR